jgi:hypothetical protein
VAVAVAMAGRLAAGAGTCAAVLVPAAGLTVGSGEVFPRRSDACRFTEWPVQRQGRRGARQTTTDSSRGDFMEATVTGAEGVRFDARRFHLWMAGVFVLIAFGGFIPTYWAPVSSGTFRAPPITHIHGLLLFSWTVFYFAQTAWIAAGRTPEHRAWGLAGISLFTLTIVSIIVLKITMLRLDDARGLGDASRRFSAVAFGGLPVMIGVFALAIGNVRRPEIHKRLMFVLMTGLMIPALARLFLTFLAPPGALAGGPPPPFVSIPPAVVASLLVVVAIVYDWRTVGRPHKAYIYGGLAVLVANILAVMMAGTETWMGIARYLQDLGG